jgi:hypothetical protein
MVDGARRDDDGVHVVAREELVVRARLDPQLPPDLFRAPRPRRRDGNEPGAWNLQGVPRVHEPHAAEAGDAEPDPIA